VLPQGPPGPHLLPGHLRPEDLRSGHVRSGRSGGCCPGRSGQAGGSACSGPGSGPGPGSGQARGSARSSGPARQGVGPGHDMPVPNVEARNTWTS
jgi:hypothetical protein